MTKLQSIATAIFVIAPSVKMTTRFRRQRCATVYPRSIQILEYRDATDSSSACSGGCRCTQCPFSCDTYNTACSWTETNRHRKWSSCAGASGDPLTRAGTREKASHSNRRGRGGDPLTHLFCYCG